MIDPRSSGWQPVLPLGGIKETHGWCVFLSPMTFCLTEGACEDHDGGGLGQEAWLFLTLTCRLLTDVRGGVGEDDRPAGPLGRPPQLHHDAGQQHPEASKTTGLPQEGLSDSSEGPGETFHTAWLGSVRFCVSVTTDQPQSQSLIHGSRKSGQEFPCSRINNNIPL